MMTRQQLLGVAGAILLAASVFLPALSFPLQTASLWEAHRWASVGLLASAGIVLFLAGAGAYPWFMPTGGVAAIIGAGQLIQIMWRISSQLTENAALAKTEPGWAGLWARSIPQVNWLGWVVLALGIMVILFAGIPNKVVTPGDEAKRNPK